MASYQRKCGRRLLVYPLWSAPEHTPSPFSSSSWCGARREATWMASSSGNAEPRALYTIRSGWSTARLRRPRAIVCAKCLPKFSALGAGRVRMWCPDSSRMLACASRRRWRRDRDVMGGQQHRLRPPPGHHRPGTRRTVRTRRFPSSSSISRTLTRSATGPVPRIRARTPSRPAERSETGGVRGLSSPAGGRGKPRSRTRAARHLVSQDEALGVQCGPRAPCRNVTVFC